MKEIELKDINKKKYKYMAKYFTLEGLEKLKKELEYLRTTKRKEITEKLRSASQQGDLSENAGYDMAKDEQGFVECRITELKQAIAQAKVIEKTESDNIQLGSTVKLSSKLGEEEFQIVSPEEMDIMNNKISSESPMGQKLLGKKKGSMVIIKTPQTKIEYKILEIR